MAVKVQIFEEGSITTLNKKINEFLTECIADVVDIKLAIAQSNHKPSYAHVVAAVIYKTT